jgi:hypothetical protein
VSRFYSLLALVFLLCLLAFLLDYASGGSAKQQLPQW